MSEPFLERLSRFTPDAGRLDRDLLLFAAGRSSVRPNRGWMALASLLAGTQALSLALLRQHPGPPAAGSAVPVAAVPALPEAVAPEPSRSLSSRGLWAARHRLLESEPEDLPPAGVTFIDSAPPFALSLRRPSGSSTDTLKVHSFLLIRSQPVPRTLLTLAALAVFAVPGRADEPSASSETLIRLNVQPAPAPKPALRYLLLPELTEMNPGNPVQNYMKCFMEQQSFFFDKAAFERRKTLLIMPLKEMPAQELQEYGGNALAQADWAARLDTPDWQVLQKLKIDGVALLLPDVQQMRPLASALKVRFRAEVALGRFDLAIRTAKTMFAMARHLSEQPTLIGDLVGFAIATIAISPLEEMLEQPGCPNLYWALTNLPCPLVPIGKGLEGERALVLAEFRDLDPSGPMSPEQLKRFIAHMDKLLGVPGKSVSVRAWLDARITDAAKVSAARGRLVEFGLPEERLLRFPADQVLLLDQKLEYEVRRDENMKIMNLQAWQAEALAGTAGAAREPALFADVLVEGVYNVRRSQGLLEQRIALLRHVEALRLYAAEHRGALPAKLSEISVPLSDDPFTGKPFRYELNGATAHLRGTPPFGRRESPNFNLHYEVTLTKQEK